VSELAWMLLVRCSVNGFSNDRNCTGPHEGHPGSGNDLFGLAASSSGSAWAVGTFNSAIRQALALAVDCS
jgi:hypothetical protein